MHTVLDELDGDADARAALAGAAAGLLGEAEMIVETVLAAPDQARAAAALPERLRAIEAGVAALSDRITRHWFALLPATQTLGWSAETVPALKGAA
jgi:hypothetical protein